MTRFPFSDVDDTCARADAWRSPHQPTAFELVCGSVVGGALATAVALWLLGAIG